MNYLLMEFESYSLGNKSVLTKRKIVYDIVNDLIDRKGLKQEWDLIEDDIKEDILNKWIGIVIRNLDIFV